MRNVKNLSLCVLLLGLLATATSVASGYGYEIVDLGTLGGLTSWSSAQGINDSGQVAGWSNMASGGNHAFVWTESGGMQDLGTLGGGDSWAYGINDSGQVVGTSRTAEGQMHAFLWTADGGMQDLGTLGGLNSWAYGINDSGQVVGESGHACMWIPATPETMLAGLALFIMDEVDLGNIDTELEVSLLAKVNAAILALDRGNPNDAKVAMNDLKALINQVKTHVDKKITPEAATEIIQKANAIIAALSVASDYEIVDLGTLGGSGSVAYGINDSGQVVGYSYTASGQMHAFLWTTDGGMQDLGTLGGLNSWAYGINNSGQVVGYSYTASGQMHAFLWTADGGMQDLGSLGGSESRAFGINDSGQVVGYAWTASLWLHAFLWTESCGMQDLGTLGGTSSEALGINNSGQVVGYAWTASLWLHACMWIPATPETMLTGLALFIMDEVDSGNIDAEMEISLLAKVDAALAALDRGNTNDAKVAMNDLKALINQVEAQVDKKITTEVAAEIIQRANAIIAVLNG